MLTILKTLLLIENGLVQRVRVEESARYKWVKTSTIERFMANGYATVWFLLTLCSIPGAALHKALPRTNTQT